MIKLWKIGEINRNTSNIRGNFTCQREKACKEFTGRDLYTACDPGCMCTHQQVTPPCLWLSCEKNPISIAYDISQSGTTGNESHKQGREIQMITSD